MSEAEYFSHFISNGNGKLLEIPQRRGRQDGVFIDLVVIHTARRFLAESFRMPLSFRCRIYVCFKQKIGGNIRVWHHEQMQIEGQ